MQDQSPYGVHILSIANKSPHPSLNQYQKLVPPWYVVKAYKESGNREQYIKDYNRLILSHLDPKQVVEDLKRLAQYQDVALVCYEKSDDFCHRHLVADWLRKAGYDMCEWSESNE
jgi:uncharacterized protein YeaO (DUF488 family)